MAKTLSALSLVSKQTLDRSRHWIFRHIDLGEPLDGSRVGGKGLAILSDEHEKSLERASIEIFRDGYTDCECR